MNPTTNAPGSQNDSLFRGPESLQEFEQPEVLSDSVALSSKDKAEIKNDWIEFYNSKLVNEAPVSRIELRETVVTESIPTYSPRENFFEPDLKPMFAIENAKGSGSIFEETGLKLDFPGLGKEIGKGLFGALGLFREIFMDTVTIVVGKKDKNAEKPETDPEKARAKAEKKAKDQRKKNNIRAFYDGLQALVSGIAPVEAVRAETQEKANINSTIKIQESYKGIKDKFGRLTIYAASMFERAQLDADKKVKKQEKEMKIASIGKAPDLNMDKAAEGGFLSSTGGQGAG